MKKIKDFKYIKIRVNYNNDDYTVVFDDSTNEENTDCLNYIKFKLIDVISYIIIEDCINFKDLLSFEFEISSAKNINPLKLSYVEQTLYACYSKTEYNGDNDVNYFWSHPFNKKINKQIISFFEGDGNSIKLFMSGYGYEFNTIMFKIKSSKH